MSETDKIQMPDPKLSIIAAAMDVNIQQGNKPYDVVNNYIEHIGVDEIPYDARIVIQKHGKRLKNEAEEKRKK